MSHYDDFTRNKEQYTITKARLPTRIGGSFLALGLVLTLQNTLRYNIGIGPGEIILGLYVYIFSLLNMNRFSRITKVYENRFSLGLVFWVLCLLTPVTILAYLVEIPGSSIGDILPYFLSISVVFVVSIQKIDHKLIGLPFIIYLLAILFYHYLFNSNNSWYGGVRFTGGATNPNQLATYIMCAHIYTILFIRSKLKLIIISIILFYFGYISRSDAYYISFIILMISFILFFLIPHKRILLITLFLLSPIALFIIQFYDAIYENIMLVLLEADQGNTRLIILNNGFKAWLSTPISFFFGNGAGAFSGHNRPFEVYEAHNTYVDLLTIGGLIGFTIMFLPIFKSLLLLYKQDRKLLTAGLFSLLVFILFHFVGRQPIFWITIHIVVCAALTTNRRPA